MFLCYTYIKSRNQGILGRQGRKVIYDLEHFHYSLLLRCEQAPHLTIPLVTALNILYYIEKYILYIYIQCYTLEKILYNDGFYSFRIFFSLK